MTNEFWLGFGIGALIIGIVGMYTKCYYERLLKQRIKSK